ncbi:hypothetical protein YSY43_12970 [Paenibacillus sp. YSY-4.3]
MLPGYLEHQRGPQAQLVLECPEVQSILEGLLPPQLQWRPEFQGIRPARRDL